MKKEQRFAHLHVHDEFSLLDGFGKAADWVSEAKRLGFGHLALTNHGNIDGCIKFQSACREDGVKPIMGCEMYIVRSLKHKSDEKRHHVTVLAKNAAGWRNILKMLTLANLDGFYRKPLIDDSVLFDHLNGLVVMTACAASFIMAEWGESVLKKLRHRLDGDLYLEVMPHMLDIQIEANRFAMVMSEKYDISLVATNDCHYPTSRKAKGQEVLLAIQRRAKWKDPNRWRFEVDGLHLRTHDEMLAAFDEQGVVPQRDVRRALRRTLEVADKCSGFNIERMPVQLPKVPGYEDRDETELLRELVALGFRRRILDIGRRRGLRSSVQDYRDRINEEIGLICDLNFQRYFLIVWELVSWCRNNDIMVGPGRGSVGGCLVAYLLGITDVDPLEYNLIFSRFISSERTDLPDIDMDFEDTKRDKIRTHLGDCYGEESVVGVSTFMSLRGKAAVRDVARVFEVPMTTVNAVTKSLSYDDDNAVSALLGSDHGKKFQRRYPEVVDLAVMLEGQIRGAGQHAAAICVSSDDLTLGLRCNLCRRKGVMVSNWDKHDAEYMGMMKLDVLGLSTLTVLNDAAKMVKANHGEHIDYNSLPLDDRDVYSEISSGRTTAAFQIGSEGLSGYCVQLGVKHFDDLVHATALWRPGTLRSGMASEFVKRKRGEKDWDVHPAMRRMTRDTYGIILYQEQLMRLAHEVGGLSWKDCDRIRKVVAKSKGGELFMEFKDQFIEGCRAKGNIGSDAASDMWSELSSFGSYGFNKAHAVEYSLITYWTMWMKFYYPAEFMACSLTHCHLDKKTEYVKECLRLGLSVVLPKIGKSHSSDWDVVDGELLVPFSEIKGVGEKTAVQISNLTPVNRDGFFEYKKNDDSVRKPNKSVIETLDRIKANDASAVLTRDEILKIRDLLNFDLLALARLPARPRERTTRREF